MKESDFFELPDELFVNRFPPGHFHSPVPSYKEIHKYEEAIFCEPHRELGGIKQNEKEQLELLNTFISEYLPDMPDWQWEKVEGLRFFHKNNYFHSKDAVILHCLVRHLRPRRIIEVGSGFSSCVLLDTNERYFNHQIQITFIEPYPKRLRENLNKSDRESIHLLEMPVQDAPLDIYDELEENDILFIDSSHISRIGSDVNHLVFSVLPRLKKGVYIHFHDIFYPFEYLRKWVLEGIAWNEAYLLRAFLQYNSAFRIRLFVSYLASFHSERFADPKWFSKPEGGARSSLWLQRVGE